MRTTDLRRQAHVAALLIGFPAFAALGDSPASEALASLSGFVAISGVLTAVLVWNQLRFGRLSYAVWAAALLIASYPQLPQAPVWSLLITGLFALVVVVLGRQVWRGTGDDAMAPPHELSVRGIRSRK